MQHYVLHCKAVKNNTALHYTTSWRGAMPDFQKERL